MQHEQSTSAPGADAKARAVEHRTSIHIIIRLEVSALELQISEQIHASNGARLAQFQNLTGPVMPTNQQQSIPSYAIIATHGDKVDQKPSIDSLNDDLELLEYEFVDFAAYGKVILMKTCTKLIV
jgi:hypothetical protein